MPWIKKICYIRGELQHDTGMGTEEGEGGEGLAAAGLLLPSQARDPAGNFARRVQWCEKGSPTDEALSLSARGQHGEADAEL